MSMPSLKKEVIKGKDSYGLDSIFQNSVGGLFFLNKISLFLALTAKIQTEQMSKKNESKSIVSCPPHLTHLPGPSPLY